MRGSSSSTARSQRRGVPLQERGGRRGLGGGEVHDDGRLAAREGTDVGDERGRPPAARVPDAVAARSSPASASIAAPPPRRMPRVIAMRSSSGMQRVDHRDGKAADAGERRVRRLARACPARDRIRRSRCPSSAASPSARNGSVSVSSASSGTSPRCAASTPTASVVAMEPRAPTIQISLPSRGWGVGSGGVTATNPPRHCYVMGMSVRPQRVRASRESSTTGGDGAAWRGEPPSSAGMARISAPTAGPTVRGEARRRRDARPGRRGRPVAADHASDDGPPRTAVASSAPATRRRARAQLGRACRAGLAARDQREPGHVRAEQERTLGAASRHARRATPRRP